MNELKGIPDVLYKYRDLKNEYNYRTLFNFEIFMSSTELFNDPYEGAMPFTYEEAELTNLKIFLKLREMACQEHPTWPESKIHEHCFKTQQKELLHDDNHIQRFNEDTKKFIRENFGVLSLTSDPNNYLMWSHYANGHFGFCIGFDKHLLFETIGGCLCPVIYETNIPKHLFDEDLGEFYRKLLMTKSNVWEYEKEFRITKVKAANKIVIYPQEMIREIYIGCNVPHDTAIKIIQFIKDNKIDCQVYQMSLDLQQFKLNHLQVY